MDSDYHAVRVAAAPLRRRQACRAGRSSVANLSKYFCDFSFMTQNTGEGEGWEGVY